METTFLADLYRRRHAEEHDACAIVASIRTSGEATHGNLKRTIEALGQMGHRSGDVQSEGDGCGVLTDIPRNLWAIALEEAGRPTWLSDDRRFFVGHLLVPNGQRAQIQQWQARVLKLVAESGADLLLERPGATRRQALGRLALAQEPLFWQVAGVMSRCPLEAVESNLFALSLAIEAQTPVHVASLSSHSVVYKVRGSVETLYHYYPELRSRDYTSAITIGHARYSTNTTTIFERVQPFTLLGHNGEINTISRLREQAEMLGTQLVDGGSDSQDVNRLLETFIHRYGFTLIEALELIFPPILTEVQRLSPELQTLHLYYRRAFGPFSQGPASIVARYGDTCMGSVDALGLRPLWYGETEKECFFSSEKGVVPMDLLNGDPKPLAPGEKIAVTVNRNTGVEVLDYPAIQKRLLELAGKRFGVLEQLALTSPHFAADKPAFYPVPASLPVTATSPYLAAFGWSRDDQTWARALAEQGRDPIASLGYDGPLAALSDQQHNLSDYFKEKVAVVTNPAVDREREQEHFSTQVVIGPRPPLTPGDAPAPHCVVLASPLLVGGHAGTALLPDDAYRQLAAHYGTLRLEDLLQAFPPEQVLVLPLATEPGESVRAAVDRLAEEALAAVQAGVVLLLLDDGPAFVEGKGWVDPHLAVARIDKALRLTPKTTPDALSYRRDVGIVVRSGALRNLHDTDPGLGVGCRRGCALSAPGNRRGCRAGRSALRGAARQDAARAEHRIGEGDQHDGHPRIARLRADLRQHRPEHGVGGGAGRPQLLRERRARPHVGRPGQGRRSSPSGVARGQSGLVASAAFLSAGGQNSARPGTRPRR